MNRLIPLMVIAAACAACDPTGGGDTDLATSADLAASDLASPDLATPDLAAPDLTAVDQAPQDLTTTQDLTGPQDLTTVQDLTAPQDLIMLQDLSMPDLVPGCVISGTVYAAGAVNPATSCQSCDPSRSTTTWTNAPNGTSCGAGFVCASNGSCVNRCYIGGLFYAPGAKNPQNDCQDCQPSVSTSTFTDIADNNYCNGGVCRSATCTPGCYIGGAFYTPGTVNPSASCQNCQPNESTSAWTVGTICGGRCVYTQSDANHCGACGRTCSTCGGTTCQHSECTPTIIASGNPVAIVLDAAYVYWANSFLASPGNISRAPLAGGPITVLASGLGGSRFTGPFGLAVSATYAYWTLNSLDPSVVQRVALSGGSPMTLASGQTFPQYIAIDNTNVYFTTLGANGDPTNGRLMSVPLAGGTPTVVTPANFPGPVVVAGGYVYWINGGPNGSAGSVLRMPTSGGTPTTVVSGLQQASGLAVDATSVYVVSGSNSTRAILRAPNSGGTPTTLASGFPSASGLAVDATNVYFTNVVNSPGGSVMRAPITGGTPTTLASGLDAPRNIAVSASCVYWTGDQRVNMAVK